MDGDNDKPPRVLGRLFTKGRVSTSSSEFASRSNEMISVYIEMSKPVLPSYEQTQGGKRGSPLSYRELRLPTKRIEYFGNPPSRSKSGTSTFDML